MPVYLEGPAATRLLPVELRPTPRSGGHISRARGYNPPLLGVSALPRLRGRGEYQLDYYHIP